MLSQGFAQIIRVIGYLNFTGNIEKLGAEKVNNYFVKVSNYQFCQGNTTSTLTYPVTQGFVSVLPLGQS